MDRDRPLTTDIGSQRNVLTLFYMVNTKTYGAVRILRLAGRLVWLDGPLACFGAGYKSMPA
jgi:hypothetical protein